MIISALILLSAQQSAAAAPCAPEFVAKAQGLIGSFLSQSGNAGVSVAFYDNGKTCVFARGVTGAGSAVSVTPDTAFAMGSVQKVFSSLLLASEIAQGKATLDDPAARYLVAGNGFTVAPATAFAKIPLKFLVTHTAALPRKSPGKNMLDGWSLFRDGPLPAETIYFLNKWSPPYPPGTRYLYSNLSHALVGYVATNIARKTYTPLLAETITRPLGMTRTARATCTVPSASCATGTGQEPVGLWSTANDLLKFVEANLGALKLSDLLAHAIALSHKELFRVDDNHGVGMAWELWHRGDALTLSKNGLQFGFTAFVALQPNRHRGVAVLSNGVGKPRPGRLGNQLLQLASGAAPQAESPAADESAGPE